MAAPEVDLCRTIRPGTRGSDVVAVKRALSRAGYMRWGAFTQMWGPFALQAAKKFQADHGLDQNGNYGPRTHARLLNAKAKGKPDEWAWDAYGQKIYNTFCEYIRNPEEKIRRAIVAAAFYWSQKRNQISYQQVRPFTVCDPPEICNPIDCSGFVTVCHHAGGAKNPNVMGGARMPWNGHGYTGTLLAGGTKRRSVNELKPGDCVFYGFTKNPKPAFPLDSPTHVALYVGGGNVITQGNNDGPEHVPYKYWSQINCYVTYDVVP